MFRSFKKLQQTEIYESGVAAFSIKSLLYTDMFLFNNINFEHLSEFHDQSHKVVFIQVNHEKHLQFFPGLITAQR